MHPAILGRTLPLNGAGVCGAALADLGFPPDMLRGFALLARTAGLLGHLAEEMRNPAGQAIYREVDEAVRYEPPPAAVADRPAGRRLTGRPAVAGRNPALAAPG